ncbi:MAG: hypothetical protein IPL75_11100 [Acidobacteria bacterium]|jgi:hypothetical protein|nr:hypothetical protein [Acidobacteriota bacterium]
MTVPVACLLTPDQLRDRKATLLPGLAGRATDSVPTDDGYRIGFSAGDLGIVTAIAVCIDAERHCCPFLQFTLTVPAEGGRIELGISGPPGTRALLDGLFT